MDGARIDVPSVASAVEETAPDASVDLLTAPPDLSEAQRAVWTTYAPHAIGQGTLVSHSVAGFRELCEQLSFKQALAARIEKIKPTSKKADALLKPYLKLVQRVDVALARFKLTAFGKTAPDAGKSKAKPANPFAAVAG